MRAQSVSEGFFKFLALMFQCLSQRDNSYYTFAAFSEYNNDHPIPEKTNSSPMVFAIIFSCIKNRPHGGFKNFPGIGEVKAMLSDILSVFVFIPFKVHVSSVDGSFTASQADFPLTAIASLSQTTFFRRDLNRGLQEPSKRPASLTGPHASLPSTRHAKRAAYRSKRTGNC